MVKYEKIIRTLMECKTLSEASKKLGISKPILSMYIRPLRMLNLIHVYRGNKVPSYELYIEE